MILLTGFVSCEDKDLWPSFQEEIERCDNLPIRLMVSIENPLEDGMSTRAVPNAKTTFNAGDFENGIPADIIHVISTFDCERKDEQGKVTKYTMRRYCAMQYMEDGTWMPMGNASFAWPNDAVSGFFTAYYIYGSTGALTDNIGEEETSTTKTLFTEITDGTDPLRADTDAEKPVKYGHTVELRFQHILTHLSLIELNAGIDEYLIFSVDPDKAQEVNNHIFNNAFEVKLSEKDGIPEIQFEYSYVPSRLKDDIYATQIKAPTEIVRNKETNQQSAQVGFFLEPGCKYNAFNVYYSNGDTYLTYRNSNPNDNRVLEENNRYTFNVKKSAGISIITPKEEIWDESDEFTVVVNAEAFLRAVKSNSGYSEYNPDKDEEVVILEPTVNPTGTLLKKNIVFQNPYYHIFTHQGETTEDGEQIPPYDFEPSLGEDNVFDGGYHYIKNLECPLFFKNNGTIKNLGFLDVNIGMGDKGIWESSKNYYKHSSENANYVNAPYEYQRTGVIATNNFGTVTNVRVKNLSMRVGIHPTEGTQEVHNVGALFGVNNSGSLVERIYLSGKLEITVENYPGSTDLPEVMIGGLAGQNVGMMQGIEQLVDNRSDLKEHKPKPVQISIKNLMNSGSGGYYIGGLVGNNTGIIREVNIPTLVDGVIVDSSAGKGIISYIGGIVGAADSSDGNEISSCLIGSGKVIAGKTEPYKSISPFSYTGGIVGDFNERTHIYNVTSFCSVKGDTGIDTQVTRATGGVFGHIQAVTTESGLKAGNLSAIAWFGDTLEGTNLGTFVGEAPLGRTWDDYKDLVDIKVIQGVNPIGINSKEGN